MVKLLLSKNPLDLLRKEKFGKEELAQALRLSVIAELDAISLYEQLGLLVDDEKIKKVFLDIAKEEKTHMGEFLTLLKSVDPEQVSELGAGAKEVEELTGIKVTSDPVNSITNTNPSDKQETDEVPEGFKKEEWEEFMRYFKEVLDSSRKLRKFLNVVNYGSGVPAVVTELVNIGDTIKSEGSKLIPLKELGVKFSIQRKYLDTMRRYGGSIDIAGAKYAAFKLGSLEDKLILKGDSELSLPGLLTLKDAISMGMSDWGMPGNAVNNVAEAVSALIKESVPEPYVLLLSPKDFSYLVSVHERTGVMELSRIRALIKEVAPNPHIPEGIALLLSTNSSVIDLAVGTDLSLDFLGPEDGDLVFRAWETVALRVKYPKGIVILKKE